MPSSARCAHVPLCGRAPVTFSNDCQRRLDGLEERSEGFHAECPNARHPARAARRSVRATPTATTKATARVDGQLLTWRPALDSSSRWPAPDLDVRVSSLGGILTIRSRLPAVHRPTNSTGVAGKHSRRRDLGVGSPRLISLQCVFRLESQNVSDRNAIQMAADFPDGQNSGVDKLVNSPAVELPAAAKLCHRQPRGVQ